MRNHHPFSSILRVFLAGLIAMVGGMGLVGCGSTVSTSQDGAVKAYEPNSSLDTATPVSLTIVGNTPTYKALESTIASFEEIYPNCDIQYEYVQDYENNLPTRLANNDNVDMFITNNIQADSPYQPYALELLSRGDSLDLSDTYEGLIKNFTVTSGGTDALYAVPLGGEIRGMYVNMTLLDSLGLSVPTNYDEFMTCCQALKDAGYVPIQGNPSNFGQLLMYPYICNIIANSDDYQATYDKVENCDQGVSELFREPMNRLYTMVEKGYYNYKYVETTYNTFTDATTEGTARSFLGIVSDGNGGYVKADDMGKVAFMPQTMSFATALDKTADDYHSGIEYRFILSPVGDDGGYAYLSPSSGIAVNRNGNNIDWSLEFMNYIFSADVNKSFAAESGIIPNTTDAMEVIGDTFDIDSSHVSQLGQVSFSYVFYDVIKQSLIDVSKANNPKYMQADGTMYAFDYYMDALENSFASQRR